MDWGRTHSICLLTHRVMEDQRNLVKLNLETVGFGDCGLCKDLGVGEGKEGQGPLSSGEG